MKLHELFENYAQSPQYVKGYMKGYSDQLKKLPNVAPKGRSRMSQDKEKEEYQLGYHKGYFDAKAGNKRRYY